MTGSVTMQTRIRRQTAEDVRAKAARQLCSHDPATAGAAS